MEVLEALVHHGSLKAVSDELGLSESAIERRLQRLRNRTNLTTVQLAYQHGRRRVMVVRYRQLRLWEDVA